MKALLIKLGSFIAISFIFYSGFSYFILPSLLEAAFGMSVEKQINTSFANAKQRDYEILVMGNSKLYCGVNPDYFSLPAFNFSHNNENYNQIYHKLRWLESNGKKFKYLILGTDFFQFSFISDTRNYAYQKYFGPEYFSDYPTEDLDINTLKKKLEFLKPYKLKTLLQVPYVRHDLKTNGQFVRRGSPGEEDLVKRKFDFLDVQVKYFDKILLYCTQRDINVLICVPPMRSKEYDQFSKQQIQEFKSFMEKRTRDNITFIDFSLNNNFGTNDFIDMAHLSQESAVLFTELLNKKLSNDLSQNILSLKNY
jgi:hypothetical protein